METLDIIKELCEKKGISISQLENKLEFGNGSVFERIYDNTMESSRRKYTKMANEFIEETFFKQKEAL